MPFQSNLSFLNNQQLFTVSIVPGVVSNAGVIYVKAKLKNEFLTLSWETTSDKRNKTKYIRLCVSGREKREPQLTESHGRLKK